MPDTRAPTPHTYEDKTSFDETKHPRAASGTFTEKAQGTPEFDLEPADVVPHRSRRPATGSAVSGASPSQRRSSTRQFIGRPSGLNERVNRTCSSLVDLGL